VPTQTSRRRVNEASRILDELVTSRSPIRPSEAEWAPSQHYEPESAWQDLALDRLRVIPIDLEFV
jgi:hypothetical protein